MKKQPQFNVRLPKPTINTIRRICAETAMSHAKMVIMAVEVLDAKLKADAVKDGRKRSE